MESAPVKSNSNPILTFINFLDKNHSYINEVYVFFAVISVVLVLLFEGFIPALFTGLFTIIGVFIGLLIINWLNTSNNGKFRLYGWILVGISIFNLFNQLIGYIVAGPRKVAVQKIKEKFEELGWVNFI
jgi:ABC-type Fe3+-siderophore transport system permease subunit